MSSNWRVSGSTLKKVRILCAFIEIQSAESPELTEVIESLTRQTSPDQSRLASTKGEPKGLSRLTAR